MPEVRVCVCSAGRPRQVQPIQELVGDAPVHWYVPADEAEDYEVPADRLHPCEAPAVPERLVYQRNQVLDETFALGAACLMLDDDLKRLIRVFEDEEGKKTGRAVPLSEAVEDVQRAMAEVGALLGGIYPTHNPYFSRQRVRTDGFCRSSFMVVDPNDLRFEASVTSKEDYDYTLQHLAKYGVVARCDFLQGEFPYKSNAGGLQRFRSPELEERVVKALEERWPGCIRRNLKRGPGEVLIRWPAKVAA